MGEGRRAGEPTERRLWCIGVRTRWAIWPGLDMVTNSWTGNTVPPVGDANEMLSDQRAPSGMRGRDFAAVTASGVRDHEQRLLLDCSDSAQEYGHPEQQKMRRMPTVA